MRCVASTTQPLQPSCSVAAGSQFPPLPALLAQRAATTSPQSAPVSITNVRRGRACVQYVARRPEVRNCTGAVHYVRSSALAAAARVVAASYALPNGIQVWSILLRPQRFKGRPAWREKRDKGTVRLTPPGTRERGTLDTLRQKNARGCQNDLFFKGTRFFDARRFNAYTSELTLTLTLRVY